MNFKPPSLEEAVQAYNRSSDDGAKLAEQERLQLVEKFPLADWPQLPLSRYALGQGGDQREVFCWWLEWGAPNIGSIRGGAAGKHMIYRQRDGSWYYDKNHYASEQEAWEAIRAGFVDAFEKAQAGQWDQIDQIPGLYGGSAVRTKTLYCYFPDELLPIASNEHIRYFLRKLDEPDDRTYEPVRLNRRLLELMRAWIRPTSTRRSCTPTAMPAGMARRGTRPSSSTRRRSTTRRRRTCASNRGGRDGRHASRRWAW